MKYQQAIDVLKNRVCTECHTEEKVVECSKKRCGYKQAIEKAIDAMEYMILLDLDKECEACKL